MNKNDTIYISGHTGLLGMAVLRVLKAQGYTNLITLNHSRNHKDLDLTDAGKTEEFFMKKKPDYVFHCAAKIGGITVTEKHQAEFLYENLMINLNVINCARHYGVKRMIVPGSVCTFPRDCPVPIKEEYALTGAFEKTCEGYAIAKMTSQKMCQYCNEQFDTEFLTTNLCNLYGVDDCFDSTRNHVIPALIQRFHFAKTKKEPEVIIRGTGNATRQFMYADDAATILVQLMNRKSVMYHTGGVVNVTVANNVPVTIHTLAMTIADVVKYNGKITFDGDATKDGAPARALDITKLKSTIPVKNGTPLATGIRKVYQRYLRQHCTFY